VGFRRFLPLFEDKQLFAEGSGRSVDPELSFVIELPYRLLASRRPSRPA